VVGVVSALTLEYERDNATIAIANRWQIALMQK
jgi:hypothetical protein